MKQWQTDANKWWIYDINNKLKLTLHCQFLFSDALGYILVAIWRKWSTKNLNIANIAKSKQKVQFSSIMTS